VTDFAAQGCHGLQVMKQQMKEQASFFSKWRRSQHV